jgi:hypothetical protein
MRILLAGAVVFLAVWFTLLRPKSDAVEPVAATPTATAPAGNVNTGEPATSAAGKIVEKAKDAATQAEGAAKAAAGESTDSAPDAAKTATGSATESAPDPATATLPELPAATLAKLPKDVAGALEARKVLVLAVLSDGAKRWRPMADDDRYVRNTLKKVNRYGGDVFVKQIPLSGLYSYGPIVNDLKVNQTPSVVVVDRKLQANVIPGYLDRLSINQAIADARAASIDPLITNSFLREANQVCADFNVATSRWSHPTIHGRKAEKAAWKRWVEVNVANTRAVKRLQAPARFKSLKTLWVSTITRGDRYVKAEAAGKKVTPTEAWYAAGRKLDHRFDEAGLTSCSIARRQ